MTMISCSECGRSISDRAAACVGCGAPLSAPSSIPLAPVPSTQLPPTRRQIRWRLLIASLMLVSGVIAARQALHLPRYAHLASSVATALILVGLVWLLITLVQRLSPRD
jgi:hypothetical protein